MLILEKEDRADIYFFKKRIFKIKIYQEFCSVFKSIWCFFTKTPSFGCDIIVFMYVVRIKMKKNAKKMCKCV